MKTLMTLIFGILIAMSASAESLPACQGQPDFYPCRAGKGTFMIREFAGASRPSLKADELFAWPWDLMTGQSPVVYQQNEGWNADACKVARQSGIARLISACEIQVPEANCRVSRVSIVEKFSDSCTVDVTVRAYRPQK